MDKNIDFPGYMPYNSNFDIGFEPPFNDPMPFNPVSQYEQGYIYYRFLCMQLEYKMKLQEYEKNCSKNRNERKIE